MRSLVMLCIFFGCESMMAVEPPDFSHHRGFLDTPTVVTISSTVPDAVIRYTIDGSFPSAMHGLGGTASAAVEITSTTALRAVAVHEGSASRSITHTYLFASELLQQTANAKGSPDSPAEEGSITGWGTTEMKSVGQQRRHLEALPILSLSLPMDQVFALDVGLMPNAWNSPPPPDPMGNDWERLCSAELFDSDSGTLFHTTCGLRMAGNGSRLRNKKSLALEFRGRYGDGVLDAPVMDTGGFQRFDELRLRAAWFDTASQYAMAMGSGWQRALSGHGAHSRFVHLVINGIYWGLYDLSERPGRGFGEDHYGRDKDHIEYYRLDQEDQTFGTNDGYRYVLGLDIEDREDFADFAAIVDVDQYADYFLLCLMCGHWDAFKEDMWIRNRQTGSPFRLFPWDLETFFFWDGAGTTGDDVGPDPDRDLETVFINEEIWQVASASDEFRLRFQDAVQRAFFSDGVFAPGGAAEAVLDRYHRQVAAAHRVEQARWNGRLNGLQATDIREADDAYRAWIGERRDFVLSDLRARGLFPATDTAPRLQPTAHDGGPVRVTVSKPAGVAGTLYLTTDGSDPREPITGVVASSAQAVSDGTTIDLDRTTQVRARVLAGGTWSPVCEAVYRVDEQPDRMQISEIMYHPSMATEEIATGLRGDYFAGSLHQQGSLIAFDTVTATRIDRTIDFDWGTDAPMAEMPNPQFGINWTGLLVAEQTTEHEILVEADGHVRLWIDEVPVIDQWQDLDQTHSSTVDLVAGHPVSIRLQLGRSSGAASVRLLWKTGGGPATVIPASALRYEDTRPTDFEFIELHNSGSRPLDLSGWSVREGIRFAFHDTTIIGAGERLVLAANPRALGRRFPGVEVHGGYAGRLANSGETIRLRDEEDVVCAEATFDDALPWPQAADGLGASLVYVGGNPDSPESWVASADPGGTPGSSGDPAPDGAVVINEIRTHTDPPQQDTIELFNPGEEEVAIGGWLLADNRDGADSFAIPAGTIIPAGEYLLFDEDDFGSAFRLSALGEEVWLIGTGAATGYVHGFPFGAQFNGRSFGRHIISTDAERFPSMAAASLGRANGAPSVGPVVLSEIHYHPAGDGIEFLELVNTGTAGIDLGAGNGSGDPWQVGGIGFRFPTDTVLAPGAVLLIVLGDPIAFRATHAVPAEVPILVGTGALDNGGERLRLGQPDDPDSEGRVGLVTIDGVRYDDVAPWPSEADGSGFSLQRRSEVLFADDPASWRAAAPTPGITDFTAIERRILVDLDGALGEVVREGGDGPHAVPHLFAPLGPSLPNRFRFESVLSTNQ